MIDTRLTQLIESVLGKGKVTNKGNIAHHCPFCQSRQKKLEVQSVTNDKGENPWHCWVCNKSGKKLTSLFKALNVSRDKIAELYKVLSIQPKYSSNQIDSTFQSTTAVDLPKEYIPLYKNSESIEYKNAIHYLRAKRKITLSEIVKYNIGYCESGEYAKKIIIPSYDEAGKLNYFVGRAYYDAESFKHKNPEVSKNCVGFELFINWTLPLVLVEGAFDAIAVRRNAIPLFGKTISEDLRKKIIENKVRQLYICLDKDAQKQALEHAEYFMNNGVEVYFVDLEEKDPAEIGFEKMCKLIKETQPLTFSKFIEYKLFG
jgi:protein-arginine kinase activator protein McsA